MVVYILYNEQEYSYEWLQHRAIDLAQTEKNQVSTFINSHETPAAPIVA